MSKPTYHLHDKPVSLVAVTMMGVQLRNNLGETEWVFRTGKAVYECLLEKPKALPDGVDSCRHCSYERLVHKCGGSCEMNFSKAGCA